MVLMLAVILWVSAAAALFVGLRTRAKPIILLGLVNGLLAAGVTTLALRGGGSGSR